MMSRGLGIIDIFSFTISFDFAFLAFVKESTGFLGELGIDEDSFFLGLGLLSEYLDGTGGITTLFDFSKLSTIFEGCLPFSVLEFNLSSNSMTKL